MAASHRSGPDVVFGQVPTQGGYPAAVNQDANRAFSPSAYFGGVGILDTRVPYNPGQPAGTAVPSWNGTDIVVVDQIPSSAATNAIASTQSATAGTAISLISASAQGIIPGVSLISATAGTVTVLSIEGSAASIAYPPLGGSVTSYDPRTMLSRAVTLNNLGGTSDATTTYTVVGFDVYGYRMTEQIIGATAQSSVGAITSANGKKAFKYIQSVTPSGVSAATNMSVGTADIFGYPLTAYEYALTTTMWASATVSGTGFTQPSTFGTGNYTSTTGDARGTYTSSSASDSAKKLMMTVMIPPWAWVPSTTAPSVISATGLVGIQA